MNGNPVGLLCIALASLGVLALWLTIWWKIFDKAGYGGGFAFLFLIPVIGVLLMFLILAFGDWPVLQELRRLRRMEMDDREELDNSGRFF